MPCLPCRHTVCRAQKIDKAGTTVVCVQPQEPVTRQPVTDPPPAVPAVPRRKNRRVRLVVALVAGVMALLCLGGVGVGIALYDNATKIKRSDPDQVTSSFLRAYLVDRSDKEAALYTCNSAPNLSSIAALRTEMIERERKFGTTVTATWESLTISASGKGSATVAVDLVIAGSSQGRQISSRSEHWSFGVVDDSGWRVCSAIKRP